MGVEIDLPALRPNSGGALSDEMITAGRQMPSPVIGLIGMSHTATPHLVYSQPAAPAGEREGLAGPVVVQQWRSFGGGVCFSADGWSGYLRPGKLAERMAVLFGLGGLGWDGDGERTNPTVCAECPASMWTNPAGVPAVDGRKEGRANCPLMWTVRVEQPGGAHWNVAHTWYYTIAQRWVRYADCLQGVELTPAEAEAVFLSGEMEGLGEIDAVPVNWARFWAMRRDDVYV